MSIKISIVIPIFNSEDYLNETLQSVFDQSYTNWECFIIDDGSTDNSSKIAHAWLDKSKQFSYHRRPENMPKGANACRNYGATLSTAEYVIFLDADDLLDKNCLASRVKWIEEKSFDLLIFRTLKFDGIPDYEVKPTPQPDLAVDLSYVKDQFANYNILWSTIACMWSKAYFFEIGGFDENLQRLQDYELHLRALFSVKESKVLIFPDRFYDTYYRKSNYHKTINIAKKKVIFANAKYIIEKNNQQELFTLDKGFYKYLIRRYNVVFEAADYDFIKPKISDTDFVKLRLVRFTQFSLFLNKVISKILFTV
ncbi:glycosyltransferase family 2 protein [Cyclobacterium salsum]|uniref:glycosyltransferase family 2 protein n=1 Tax=Cyclobacterium salsum TaxID=2666329 RepID=UPI00139186F4|nr:glycosyltransferase family 2 protein [Cyclobacterium salsum]